MSSSLEVRTRAEGTVGVVELVGDVSAEGESQILQAYESETAEGRRDILIELSGAAYINTSGISVLIELAMAAKKADIHIMVSGASPHYRKIFDLVRFSTFVDLFDTEADAVASRAGA